jgi:hypothetical protein
MQGRRSSLYRSVRGSARIQETLLQIEKACGQRIADLAASSLLGVDMGKSARLVTRGQGRVVDHNGKIETPFMRHGLHALSCPVAFLVVVGLAPALGRARDDGNEEPAMAAYGIFEVAFEVVAADQPVVIEPDQAAGCLQFLDDPEGRCRIGRACE